MYIYFKRFVFDIKYTFVFLLLYSPLILIYIHKQLKNIAHRKLLRFDSVNKSVVDELPYIVFTQGPPGIGKTSIQTDMSQYAEEICREKALDEILYLQSMFPGFPFREFEVMIDTFRADHIVWNWRSIEDVISQLADDGEILGYKLHDKVYLDGLRYNSIQDVLSDYACLYFLYSTTQPVEFSNYPIRTDNRLESLGNFPFMNFDQYVKTEYDVVHRSTYTCNLVRDMVRTGKKYNDIDDMIGAFEFGVFCETEADKEYGNKNTNEGQKKKDKLPNSKNDGANIFKMLIRHFGTKRFVSYVKWFYDAQRKDSVNAGLTQISTVVNFVSKSELKSTYLFYGLVKYFHDIMWNWYKGYLMSRKVYRADYTLRFYIIDKVCSKLHNMFVCFSNIYTYKTIDFSFSDGLGENEDKKQIYRLMTKRVYSDKYATDVYRELLRSLTNPSDLGYDDFDRFSNIYATRQDFDRQGSRLIKDITEPGWDDDENDVTNSNFDMQGLSPLQKRLLRGK